MNGLLIASRGWYFPGICTESHTGYPFFGVVRLPGFWEGSCANCKWKERTSSCHHRDPSEARRIPAGIAALPEPSRLEELVDDNEEEEE